MILYIISDKVLQIKDMRLFWQLKFDDHVRDCKRGRERNNYFFPYLSRNRYLTTKLRFTCRVLSVAPHQSYHISQRELPLYSLGKIVMGQVGTFENRLCVKNKLIRIDVNMFFYLLICFINRYIYCDRPILPCI